MIKLKLTYFNETTYETIVPTIFPDTTSQVNRIKSLAKEYRNVVQSEIIWQYENEAEFVHVAQLADLVDSYTGYPKPLKILNIPFLPYGRQDKPISNSTTFAQRTFTKLVDALGFDRVITFDCHGICAIKNLQKLSANETLKKVFDDNKYDVYAYLDGSACEKYTNEPNVHGVKLRDKQTGKVADYYLESDGIDLKDKRVLIVSDLCDKEEYFAKLSELLKAQGAGEIGLYVSHLVANNESIDKLKETGVSHFFTTNSLPKNEELGIKVV